MDAILSIAYNSPFHHLSQEVIIIGMSEFSNAETTYMFVFAVKWKLFIFNQLQYSTKVDYSGRNLQAFC